MQRFVESINHRCKMSGFFIERNLNMQKKKKKKLVTERALEVTTGGFGDGEREVKIDSVWKSWGGKGKWEKQQTRWQCYEMLFWEEASCFLLQ